jgi:hypothetical protein
MISSVIRVSCATCGRKVHGIAPLGWTAEQLVEHVELDEHGWQMHVTASTPEAEDLPSSYEHSALCPTHRKAFGQDFPGAKRVTMRAPATEGAELEQERVA